MILRLIALGVLLAVPGAGAAWAQGDALPLRHGVRGNTIGVEWPDFAELEVSGAFRYVAGQRFLLRGVADAEQHVFAVHDVTGAVSRLLWVQLEHYLTSAPGSYDYSADSLVTVKSRSFRVGTRRFTTRPDSTSDRGAMYALLRRHNLVLADTSIRVRWVTLNPDRRSEVMIIYVESVASPASPSGDSTGALIERARSAFNVVPRRIR